MTVQYIECDRCHKRMTEGERYNIHKKPVHNGYAASYPTKIDLCEDCTKEVFGVAKEEGES